MCLYVVLVFRMCFGGIRRELVRFKVTKFLKRRVTHGNETFPRRYLDHLLTLLHHHYIEMTLTF